MEHTITIVDENNKVIGSASRPIAVSKGLWHQIVVVLVFNAKGQLYIQKRSPTADTCPNMWDHSAAGHVDENEEPDQAAKRELLEELGIKAKQLIPISIYKTQRSEGEKHYNRYWHLYKLVYNGEFNFQKNEVAEGKFVDISWLEMELRLDKEGIYTDGLRKSLAVYLNFQRQFLK